MIPVSPFHNVASLKTHLTHQMSTVRDGLGEPECAYTALNDRDVQTIRLSATSKPPTSVNQLLIYQELVFDLLVPWSRTNQRLIVCQKRFSNLAWRKAVMINLANRSYLSRSARHKTFGKI